MHGMNGYMGYSPNLWMILMMIFIMGLVVIGIVLVIHYLRKEQPQDKQIEAASQQTPIEIIQQRLAKGEIDMEEYERLKQTLEQS